MSFPARVRVTGPLAVHASGFLEELTAQGYTPLSAANQLRLLAHLSRWLAGEGLSAEHLTVELAESFLKVRRSQRYTAFGSMRGLSPLLGYLRGQGAAPMPGVLVASTPLEEVLDAYCTYLVDERGLSTSTVHRNAAIARLFLVQRSQACDGDLALSDVTARDVSAFVLAVCSDRSVGSAKLMVTGLRSLLGFLHVTGRISGPLDSAVPAVAGWRGGSLPRALPASQVAALLASCDRRRAVGRRDFAILTLLSRLGLRAGEVAALELGDLEWRVGAVVVRGKQRRQERLPLPNDVGEAIVAYLRRGRWTGNEQRAVFLQLVAPYRRLSDGGVKQVVRTACDRAGQPRVGPHRLRHSVATQMLQAGAGLGEVAQVLRHRELSTTAIYAKVDRNNLRGLALPWPGSAQ